ncbi:MAG: DUF481 domain-containing protein [Candidatus Aminicenantales bacterium]
MDPGRITRSLLATAAVLAFSSALLFSGEKENGKKKKPYFSSTSFSALLTSGNSRDFTFSMDTDQNLRIRKHKLNFRGKIIYARSNGEKKSEIYGSSLAYNFQLNTRTYFLTLSSFDRNVLSGYNWRFAFSAGAGYTWASSKTTTLSTEAAFGWSTENNAEKLARQAMDGKIPAIRSSASSSFASSILRTRFSHFISSTTEFILQEIVFLDLRNVKGYRLTSYSSLSASINRFLALKTSVQVNYENRPVPGFKSTDLFFLSSLVFRI